MQQQHQQQRLQQAAARSGGSAWLHVAQGGACQQRLARPRAAQCSGGEGQH